ncbi:MAG: glutathione peroxidase [Acinetobacter sp.]|jgi:glutathione peroxidase|uniref:Glutathione peroxidase n=1 Tax=Acinetobacter albensis TaxID=1673609 RepID=A0A1C4GVL7_9GAMM|nr:glutathione peroxidase [Acinetobacter albensis]SCC72222.1 glutathione peroxidase [Acinetobacter albensis]
MTTIYDFQAEMLEGEQKKFSEYQGKVLLIVNTASQCGLTPQFEGLEQLYQDYQSKGLIILGFPCNQFAHQDPLTNEEIGGFCQRNYGVSFPMFAKVDVNGSTAHPLYQYLTAEAKGILGSQKIKWNFTKFLINQEGKVIKRYAPLIKPEKIAKDIQKLLS